MAMELLVILPSVRRLPPDAMVEALRRVSGRSLPLVPTAGLTSAVAAILVLVLEHDFGEAATILTLIGLVTLVAAAAATIALYVPIFLTAKEWPGGAPPEAYEELVRRWTRAQAVRATLYCGSLGCFIVGAVLS
jgi:uncharacterized membrane protein YphA (DoxX/SURF4 family)